MGKDMTRLRIAYVASRWDYGDPARGLSFEETNFRSALEGMGHEVHGYDFMTRHKELGQQAMNDELGQFVLDVEPDLAVFVLFKDEIDFDTISGLTKSGVKTFNWFCDDHWRFEGFSRHYAPAFSLVSTTHHESIAKYAASGYHSVLLSQWACNRHSYDRRPGPIQYDVTFVGQRYGNRAKIVNAIRKAGFDVRCWGQGWTEGRLGHEEMVNTFSNSRINLNLSNSWTGPLWRRRPRLEQIKARVFEVPGSGGFLLTQRAPHLEEYLDPNNEIATFDDTGSLVEQIGFWLGHEDERAAMASRAYEHVRREHTYDVRFAEIFSTIGLC